MRKLLTHCCAWLQQNNELALLAIMAFSVIGFTAVQTTAVLFFSMICVSIVSGGIFFSKIRSQRSLRVPATKGIWATVCVLAVLATFIGFTKPHFAEMSAAFVCLLTLLASFGERQRRYTIARARVQKRRVQQAKWRRGKREVLDEWKERLRWLAGVQHDMRQPLHAMGLLINHPEFKKYENQQPLVKRIHSCQRWLQELAENTLEVTRLELNERRATEITSISSIALCANLETWIAQLAETKGLSMVVEVEEQTICSDARRLKRVIGNLLFNAVEHTFEGEVSLHYRRIGGVHQFIVRDNGPGISEAIVHPKKPIKSAFGSDLPKAGIGLYVVRKLCAEMSWNLTLTNEFGGGATFVLEFADCLPGAQQEVADPSPMRKAS